MKANSVWMSLAVFLSVDPSTGQDVRLLAPIVLFLSATFWAVGSILANDLSDTRCDQAAGKPRWILKLSKPRGIALVCLVFLLGFCCAALAGAKGPVLVYPVALFLSLAYSFPPLRWKDRRIWGLVVYSAACAAAYVVLPWSLLRPENLWLFLVGTAVFLNKWVNLLFHQTIDLEDDQSSGLTTYAASVGRQTALRALKLGERAAAAWLVLVAVCVCFFLRPWGLALLLPLLGVLLGVRCYLGRGSKKTAPSLLLQHLSWPYLGATFAVFCAFPVLLWIRLAALYPAFSPAAALATAMLALESLQSYLYPTGLSTSSGRVDLALRTLSTLLRTARMYIRNRSLKPVGLIATRLFRQARGRPAPLHMSIALTRRCTHRCVHCYAQCPQESEEDELSTDEVKSLLLQARQMGILQIFFDGGEPLLREDLLDLIRCGRDLGFLTTLNTNGWLMDGTMAAALKTAGVTQCRVSIDDPDPEECDRLRGRPGTFHRAVQAIRNLREAGVTCQINTYISKRNAHGGLERIIALGRQLGVFGVFGFFPVAVGNWDGKLENVLTRQEKEHAWDLQDMTFFYLELPSPQYECCVVTKSLIYISATGDLAPCPFTPYHAGNIREHSLLDIWENHVAHFTVRYRGGCPLNNQACRARIGEEIERGRTGLRG